MDVVNYFNEGVTLYRDADWDKAADRFARCLEFHPGDALSALYIERCRHLAANPPGDDWNGAWVMTGK